MLPPRAGPIPGIAGNRVLIQPKIGRETAMRGLRHVLVATALTVGVGFAGGEAQADVVISKKATANMSCAAGVCSPTAAKAVLNATDLANMLASGDVKVVTGSGATNIVVKDAFSWTSTSRLTLDAMQSVEFDKPVTVAGTGAMTITTNDGGSGGEFSILPENGSIQFWDSSSSLVIDGQTYTLVGDIKTLAADIAANPSGFYALAKPYDASVDGTYSNAPITTTFRGAFDGLGNTFSNVTVTFTVSREFFGSTLFSGIASSGEVRHIGVTEASLAGSGSGDLSDLGLLASVNLGTVEQCWTSGTISAPGRGANAGGLVGGNGGTITNSHANTKIALSGGELMSLGAMVGANYGAVRMSSALGSLSEVMNDSTQMGGFAGYNKGIIQNAFTRAAVHNPRHAENSGGFGGFVGVNDSGGEIVSSYTAGPIRGYSSKHGAGFGGFVGFDASASGSLASTYWDLEKGIPDPSHGAGNIPNDPGIQGLTTGELQSGLPAGFDPKIWGVDPKINNGYPYLINNPPPQ
jgi:hypothetical protein